MDQKEHTDDWDSSEDKHISLDELSKLLEYDDEDGDDDYSNLEEFRVFGNSNHDD
jgi:hypothetical protein